jgi:hypothetical protein
MSSPKSSTRTASSSPGSAFDLSRHPLVTHRLGSAYTNADFDRMLRELVEIVKRGPFVLITDLRSAQLPDAVQRRAFIDMYERYDGLTRANFRALSAVGDSIRLRGVITALNWLRPAPHPVGVFTTFQAAEAWALAQLPESLRKKVPPAAAPSG